MRFFLKVRNLLLLVLVPALLVLIGLAAAFVLSTQFAARDAWESQLEHSLQLVAQSPVVSTYAEYRSFGLEREAEVFAGFVADNLAIFADSLGVSVAGLAGPYLVDAEAGLLVLPAGAPPEGGAEAAEIAARARSLLGPGGDGGAATARPGFLAGRGRPYAFARRLERSGRELLLYLELPSPFAGFAARFIAWILLFLAGFAALLALIDPLVKRAIRQVTDPIERLRAVSDAVSRGDQSARAERESDDEIGDLAEAFNGMLDRLSLLIEERSKILESITDGFLALDGDWRLSYLNREGARILGSERETLVGRDYWEAFPLLLGTELERFYRKAMEQRRSEALEHRIELPGGEPRWVGAKAYPVADGGLSVYLRDETERKRAEEALAASLRQKELLLREIHHRVKNNLQVMASLVELQREGGKVPLPFARSFVDRIRAMSEVYDCLAGEDDYSRVDFEAYARGLSSYLYQGWREEFDEVTVGVESEVEGLDIDLAFPCGLILNELLSNAFRHAFVRGSGRRGTILVALRRDGPERLRLEVRDDGKGLPAGLDAASIATGSDGLPLVALLAAQMGGKLEFGPGPGSAVAVGFPVRAVVAGARLAPA